MTYKEVQAEVKDLRSHGYYSDPLMLFENFSMNVEAGETLFATFTAVKVSSTSYSKSKASS